MGDMDWLPSAVHEPQLRQGHVQPLKCVHRGRMQACTLDMSRSLGTTDEGELNTVVGDGGCRTRWIEVGLGTSLSSEGRSASTSGVSEIHWKCVAETHVHEEQEAGLGRADPQSHASRNAFAIPIKH